MVKSTGKAIYQSKPETRRVGLRAYTVHMVKGQCFRMSTRPPPAVNFVNLKKSSEDADKLIYSII